MAFLSENIIYDLYQEMTKGRIISAYHGDFSQAVIEMLLKQAKLDLSRKKLELKVFKKAYGVLIEVLENILKHTVKIENDPETDSEAIVLLSSTEDGITISVGNVTTTEEAKMLEQKINQVNSLDKSGLQLLHTEILKNGSISEKGGAGLGLIEISIKSNNKIEYFFNEYKKNLVFFALQTKINN